MALSRDDILNANDLPVEPVECPEWGGMVLISALSGTERDAYEASMVTIRGKEATPNMQNARAKLVARAAVDKDGNRLFSDQDVKALGKKSSAALDRCYDVAARLSSISETDVEEAEENFDEGQSDDSTSS